jgi:hypothetical protein
MPWSSDAGGGSVRNTWAGGQLTHDGDDFELLLPGQTGGVAHPRKTRSPMTDVHSTTKVA